MTVKKPKPKQLLRPITTGARRQRYEPITIPSNYICMYSLEARERSRVHGAIGFGLACHWLKN